MKDQVKNLCKSGQCSRCGECCTPFIPITTKEYKTIEKYIKENNIECENPVDGNNVHVKCCFYNRKEKKCNIYPVRPEVCRRFQCNKTMQQIRARRKHFNNRADINKVGGKIQGMDELFYGKLDCLLYQIKYYNPQNTEEFIKICETMGRKDIIQGIKEGKIKLGWSNEEK